MQAIEIVVIICSILFVIGVAVWAFIRKKQGKSTCEKCKQAIKQAREQIKKDNEKQL